MTRIFIILCFLTSALMADVKSTTGQIKFDAQMDNQAEMTLNSTGLGIGVTPSSNLHVNGNAIVTEQLFVGGSSGSSNLNVNGTIGYGFQTVSSNTTLGEASIVLVDSSSDNITIILPYAGNVIGRQYQIKKISTSNSVWISGGGNLIDDTSPIELPESSDFASVKLLSDGTQWYKIRQKGISGTVAADNLVGWWKLNELGGSSAFDSSDSNFPATLQGGQTFSGCTQSGIFSDALSFDGIDDYATISSSLTSLVSTEVTISAWVRAEGSSFDEPFEAFLTEDFTGDGRVLFSLYGAGTQVRAGFYDGSWHTVVQSGSFSFGQWVHVVGSYDGSTLKIYIDGILNNSVADATGLPTNATGGWRIGRRHDLDDYFKGLLDDIRIYNRALTAAEIQALNNQG